MRTQDSQRFLDAIALIEVDAQLFDRAFEAVPQYVPWPKAYGGDAVAQALAAASATVDGDRFAHSLHSNFLRPIDAGTPVRYEVELTRDGRSFSTRYVRGFQGDRLAYASTVSFQVPEGGPRLHTTMAEVPSPDSLPSSAQSLAGFEGNAADYWAHGRSFDHRHVHGPLYFDVATGSSENGTWIRSFGRLPDNPAVHRLAIAYVCDYTILEPSLRALDVSWAEAGLTTASLDHTLWVHAEARADDWLYYAKETVGIQSGRALNVGRFFDRSGTLVASVAQEGLIRIAP